MAHEQSPDLTRCVQAKGGCSVRYSMVVLTCVMAGAVGCGGKVTDRQTSAMGGQSSSGGGGAMACPTGVTVDEEFILKSVQDWDAGSVDCHCNTPLSSVVDADCVERRACDGGYSQAVCNECPTRDEILSERAPPGMCGAFGIRCLYGGLLFHCRCPASDAGNAVWICGDYHLW